jgi:hypothetical protein
MSTSENILIDRAVQLDGKSLQLMRASQKKWFIYAVITIAAYAVAMGVIALEKEVGGGVALFALPLFIVVFQAGRLAGRVDAVDRVRAMNRG